MLQHPGSAAGWSSYVLKKRTASGASWRCGKDISFGRLDYIQTKRGEKLP